jgi:hypothetical protein
MLKSSERDHTDVEKLGGGHSDVDKLGGWSFLFRCPLWIKNRQHFNMLKIHIYSHMIFLFKKSVKSDKKAHEQTYSFFF